jgi:hypothetical protein
MLLFVALASAITLPTLDPHPAVAFARVSVTILHAERIDFDSIPLKRGMRGTPDRRIMDFE